MTGLGEWDDDAPVYDLGDAPVADVDEELDEPLGGAAVAGKVAATLDGLDVASIAGGLVAATVTTEIHRQVQREVAPIVTEAVAAVLTPDRLDALRAAATAAAEAELNPPPDKPAEEEGTPTLYYGSVDEFVREFVCPIFRRNVGEEGRADYRWSARWWESAEAIARLEATWRAWEHLRMDASTGTSVWLRDHADHHLGVLMSPTGPWALSKDTAGPSEPLPYEAPPEGLFPDVRDG
jgi:hypothetical protein